MYFSARNLVCKYLESVSSFTPKEEKKRSGPFDFLKNQISKLQEDEENDKDNQLADYLKGKSYMPKKKSLKQKGGDGKINNLILQIFSNYDTCLIINISYI